MRINTPVTDKEFLFSAATPLVSVTDSAGLITYCNDAFVLVSGFGLHEMLGQSHNIHRHPGVPAEVFRDLWETIEAGHHRTGVFKNRRKNGDFYWVRANTTPLLKGNSIVGYLSVRVPAERDAIADAEALYARMHAENVPGNTRVRLSRGRVLRLGSVAL